MELRCEAISHRFFRSSKMSNYFYALQNIDFTLPAGSLTEITGRSGSGKSTLLNVLSGLLKPTEGRVLLDGTDLYSLSDDERSRCRNDALGIIPQRHTGLRSLTVRENILLPCLMYGIEADETWCGELMERLSIANLRDAYPNELSGGEMRRLAIARALIRKPAIVLADEPTGDLDDGNTEVVLTLLRQIADEGKAVLLVTHEREAAAYSDSVFRMENGTISRL